MNVLIELQSDFHIDYHGNVSTQGTKIEKIEGKQVSSELCGLSFDKNAIRWG